MEAPIGREDVPLGGALRLSDDDEQQRSFARKRARHLLGVFFLMSAVAAWVGGAELSQRIQQGREFNKPYFLVWFNHSWLSPLLPLSLVYVRAFWKDLPSPAEAASGDQSVDNVHTSSSENTSPYSQSDNNRNSSSNGEVTATQTCGSCALLQRVSGTGEIFGCGGTSLSRTGSFSTALN